MKKYILLLLAICSINIISGQDLIIELSVIWKNENIYLSRDFIKQHHTRIPYLKITYRNFSSENIYFKDNFGDSNALYSLMGDDFQPLEIDELDLTDFLKKIEKEEKARLQENYIVLILNCLNKNTNPCFAVFEKKYENKERELGIGIDSDLYYLTRLLHLQERLNKHYPKKQIPLFNYIGKSTITLENAHKLLKKIESKNASTDFTLEDINFVGLKDHFIFLKKGEIYEREINLLPLLLLGGKYHFKFASLKMDNVVDGGYICVNDELKQEKIALPKEIKGYKLYDRIFISNEVYVDFSNIR